MQKYPFCDTGLSHDARLDDLVKRINVSEMGSQMTARESSALGRLGIPAYYCMRGPHAARSVRPVVTFGRTGASSSPPY